MREIFGVQIEGWTMSTTVEYIEELDTPVWIVTANPEILLEAKRDPDYRKLLQQADVRLVDGFGLWLATFCRTKRVTGVEFAERLLQIAHDKKWRVGLFGGMGGEAKASLPDIKRAYPDLSVLTEQGGKVSMIGEEDDATEEARGRMMQFSPHVLLVAMGHPRQEAWIAQHRKDFPELKAIVGVGGTFRFWSGKSKRAPHFLRTFGLEWLWRLFVEPYRWKRIFNAVVVFPILAIVDKMSKLG